MKFWELINRSDFLKDKFKNLEDHFKEIEINGISNNSKNVKNNFIFFTFAGNNTNGNLYINEARKNVYGDIKKIKFDKAFYRKDIGL